MSLARPEIEGLTPFLAWPDFELDFVAVAQILEIDLGREPRAMEKDLLASVVRDNETEALVFHDFLDSAVHLFFVRGRTALLNLSPAGSQTHRRVGYLKFTHPCY
jgi:hypothetical protein